jgi:hypothetical protein
MDAQTVVVNETYQFEFALLFEVEDEEALTGIEVWRFRDEDADIRFLLSSSFEYPMEEDGDPLYYDYVPPADRF